MKRILYTILVLLIIGLGYFRTWFHGVLLFLYATPIIWQVVLITIVIHYGVFNNIGSLTKLRPIIADEKNKQSVNLRLSTLFSVVLFCILLIVGFIGANWARDVRLAEVVEYKFTNELPNSTQDLRLMPYEVAQRYAKDSLQLSQYRLGTENIAMVDGRLSWTFPLRPEVW